MSGKFRARAVIQLLAAVLFTMAALQPAAQAQAKAPAKAPAKAQASEGRIQDLDDG